MEMISQIAVVCAAVAGIAGVIGLIYKIFGWVFNEKKQNSDLQTVKEENALLVYGLLACLDGLEQLGANHTVTEAKNKLEKHINLQAHK